jgi:hypothetical protein
MSVTLNRVTVDMNVTLNASGSLEIKTTKELDLEPRLSALLNSR